uniref:Uncharacterized protein n=1 Tax=Ditylenchus dipsaci TaxID=166011 RepID=A0A915DLK2_9BILA
MKTWQLPQIELKKISLFLILVLINLLVTHVESDSSPEEAQLKALAIFLSALPDSDKVNIPEMIEDCQFDLSVLTQNFYQDRKINSNQNLEIYLVNKTIVSFYHAEHSKKQSNENFETDRKVAEKMLDFELLDLIKAFLNKSTPDTQKKEMRNKLREIRKVAEIHVTMPVLKESVKAICEAIIPENDPLFEHTKRAGSKDRENFQ